MKTQVKKWINALRESEYEKARDVLRKSEQKTSDSSSNQDQ